MACNGTNALESPTMYSVTGNALPSPQCAECTAALPLLHQNASRAMQSLQITECSLQPPPSVQSPQACSLNLAAFTATELLQELPSLPPAGITVKVTEYKQQVSQLGPREILQYWVSQPSARLAFPLLSGTINLSETSFLSLLYTSDGQWPLYQLPSANRNTCILSGIILNEFSSAFSETVLTVENETENSLRSASGRLCL